MRIRITGVEVLIATCIMVALLFYQPLPVAIAFYVVFLGAVMAILFRGGAITYGMMEELHKQSTANQLGIKLIKRRQRKIMATMLSKEPPILPPIEEEPKSES
jgi:RsiW-degrading membrane proteinase PrsW (M82 family)